ncbi:MAG TPA: DUF1996 domain-containing protein [Methylomirabilota bacterium]|nr:DUF1996 domain-containing protein [Methylomirabilota bacterium]
MNKKLLAYQRTDPIVESGIVSGHVHAVIGNNHFRQTFDPQVWSDATCTTMEIQENKSNYWVPSLYGIHDNGTYSAIPPMDIRVYYLNHVS